MMSSEEREVMNSFNKWVVIAVICGGVVWGASTLFTIVTTPVNSAVDVAKKTLAADNILYNYEWFFDVDAKIDARVRQIEAHKKLLAEEQDPAEKTNLRIELVGMQQSCRDLSAQYNSNGSKANVNIFRSSKVPLTQDLALCE